MPVLFSPAGSAAAHSGMPSAVSKGLIEDSRVFPHPAALPLSRERRAKRSSVSCAELGQGLFTVAMVSEVRLPRGFEMQ